MGEKHELIEQFTIPEYTRVQRQLHRQILLEQHSQGKISVPPSKLFPPKAPSEGAEDGESDDSRENFTVDDYYFLQPLPTRQRRTLLRQSGVKKIDVSEKEDCKSIRLSREVCGCDCRVYCDPETCICSKAGIKCQVDRLSFPCGCSKDGCGNKFGRIEFNPIRVRTHFLHTVMRLEMEKKYGTDKEQRRKSTASSNLDNSLVENGPRIVDDESECNSKDDEEEEEDTDVECYNSNERGSCCDCQKSEIPEILMQEAQFSSPTHSMDSTPTTMRHNNFMSVAEDTPLGVVTGGQSQSNAAALQQHVMMFSNEDDDYNAENTTAMYTFVKEESSYSESSDCSSEGSGTVEEPAGYQTFQTLSSFTTDTGSGNGNGGSGMILQHGKQQQQQLSSRSKVSQSSFTTIPPPNNISSSSSIYLPPTQPEVVQPNKYMELSSTFSSSYKLEPISEILNPIRFSSYSSPGSGSTSWNGEYVSQYARQDASQNGVDLCGVGTFTESLNSNTTPLTTADSTFYNVPLLVAPPVSSFNGDLEVGYNSNHHITGECSTGGGPQWGMTPTPICSTTVSEAFSHQATSMASPTRASTMALAKPCLNSNLLTPLNHTMDSPPDILLDCHHGRTSPTMDMVEPSPSEQSPGQNFGEIIKESIVETVSA